MCVRLDVVSHVARVVLFYKHPNDDCHMFYIFLFQAKQLEQLAQMGFQDVGMCLNHLIHARGDVGVAAQLCLDLPTD